jgi:hypothetical protein
MNLDTLLLQNCSILVQKILPSSIGGVSRQERIPEKPKEELIVLITGLFISFPDTSDALAIELSVGINATNFFINFFIVNTKLAVFNLIPAFPMDVGKLLRALLPFKFERHIAPKIAAQIGPFLAIGFIFLGFLHNFFLIFIGLFVIMGAQMESKHADSKYSLKGYKVRDVLMKQHISIDAGEPIKTAINLLLDSQSKTFLITEDNEPVGTLNRDQIIIALSEKGENTVIHSAMNKNLIYLDVEILLENIFELVYKNKTNLMLVI